MPNRNNHGTTIVPRNDSIISFDGRQRVQFVALATGFVYPKGALLVANEQVFKLATSAINQNSYFVVNIEQIDLTSGTTSPAVLVAGTVREELLVLPEGIASLDQVVDGKRLRDMLAAQGIFAELSTAKVFDAPRERQ